MKRITSLLLTLLMAVSVFTLTLPLSSGAVESVTGGTVIFVDENAAEDGKGATPDKPLKSIYSAAVKVAETGGGTIVVVGTASVTANNNIGNGDANVFIKITSVYDGVDYRKKGAKIDLPLQNKHIILKNGMIFENIVFNVVGKAQSIYADHYPLVIGYGVETTGEAKLNIYGGSARDLSACKNFPETSSVTVLSGSWDDVKASGKGSNDAPRDTKDAQIGLNLDFKSKGAPYVAGIEKSVITGKKLLIKYNGFESEETVDNTMTVTGTEGYIIPTATYGKFYILADKGYAANVDGEVMSNGVNEIKNLNAKITFVESDVNDAADFEASRPYFGVSAPESYITGYTDGTFKPSNKITIAEASTIIVRLMNKVEASKDFNETKFENVKSTDWFFNTIAFLEAYNFYDTFEGFDPNRPITRAEFVSMINTAGRIELKGEALTFSDVPTTHKYYSAIQAAASNKLVNGYTDGTFGPEKSITRAEVVAVINRQFDTADTAELFNKNKVIAFSDVPDGHWAYYQIIVASGGKDKPVEQVSTEGTGIVEYEVEGKAVFVSDTGAKENDGLSAEKPLQNISAAGSLLAEGGTLVVCGPLTINANYSVGTGKTDKTVLITSLYDGVDYRKTNDAAIIMPTWKNLIPSCTTIFDNVTFHTTGTSASIYCDNRNVTFGKDVVCIKDDKAAYLNIYGGSANDLGATVNYVGAKDVTEAYSNIAVYGGVWSTIQGTGKGDAKKPTPTSGLSVVVGENAIATAVTGGKPTEFCGILGKRLVGTINQKFSVTPGEETADYVFIATGKGDVKVIEQASTYVVIKATAEDGKKIEGLADDGTYKFEGENKILSIDFDGGKAALVGEGDLADSIEVVPDAFLSELDKKTEARIAEIKATVSTIKPASGSTAYYVSESTGSDTNDGKAPETAWKTTSKVGSANLLKGDVVYFKRGDTWRNVSLTAKNGVTYTAYGEGAKPRLYGSPFDGTKTGKWEATDVPNVYKYSERMGQDVGQIVFNNGEHGIYSQKIACDYSGAIPVEQITRREFTGYKDLKNDLEFFHDLDGAKVENSSPEFGFVYLYSDKGNPSERFTNIEFNRRGNIIRGTSNVTIDNLAIMYGGNHGVGAGTCTGLTVQNCEFWWIGGSMQGYTDKKPTRFGNAVEIYGGAEDYTVSNCYIDEVYDAGVTHQVSDASDGDYIMKNVTYKDNVILRNVYSIEHFCRKKVGTTRYLINIFYLNNICRFAGAGFGKTRPDKGSPAHIRSGILVDTGNFIIEGNVFDTSTYDLLKFQSGGDEAAEFKNNVFIQTKGAAFGTLKGGKIIFNSFIKDAFGANAVDVDKSNVFYYAK